MTCVFFYETYLQGIASYIRKKNATTGSPLDTITEIRFGCIVLQKVKELIQNERINNT